MTPLQGKPSKEDKHFQAGQASLYETHLRPFAGQAGQASLYETVL